MLRLNAEKLIQTIDSCDVFQTVGTLRSAKGIMTTSLQAGVKELVQIVKPGGDFVLAQVVGFDDYSQILPLEQTDGIAPRTRVVGMGRKVDVPVGWDMLGRIVDGLGRPVDGKGPIVGQWRQVISESPDPLERPSIVEPFETGISTIDGLLTCGRGQRVGLFAGSGVGKSTLLGEIAKSAHSDINVVAMIGERGREVRPFLERCLGQKGLERSIVVVATSEAPCLMRLQAALTAVTIADYFRSEGANVLLLMDSLTRLAMAQREIGLMLGEPPSARGYTPSVFQLLADVLELLGNTSQGSITGLLTVLVDGDDMEEPVADAVRAIIDGHIVLDRNLAERGQYPAIDISKSVSRVFTDVANPQHQLIERRVREILSTYREVEDLIRIGAYTLGTSPQIDKAITLEQRINSFLRQAINQPRTMDETISQLGGITQSW